jgi:transcriptional regulator with XRE-family HTH domain
MADAHDALITNVLALAGQRGLSINRLADSAGISRGALSHILRKEKSPRLETVERLAGALEVPVAALFWQEGYGAFLEAVARSGVSP